MPPPFEISNSNEKNHTFRAKKDGQSIFKFNFGNLGTDPTDIGGTAETAWAKFHKQLLEMLGMGKVSVNIADILPNIQRDEYNQQQLEKKLKTTWSIDDTSKYINELYYRIVKNPRFDQAADIQNDKEQDDWDTAIINYILGNLTNPDILETSEENSSAINIVIDILINESDFVSIQGFQSPLMLLKEKRTLTTIEEMKDEGWISQELFDEVLNLPKIKTKFNTTEDLTDLEIEAYNLANNINYTDSERLDQIYKDDTGQSYKKWNQTTLRSVSEDDKLNGKGVARLFPISEHALREANQAVVAENSFNLWNQDSNYNNALNRVAGSFFRSDNNIEQAILNNAKNEISNRLSDKRHQYAMQGLPPDEIERRVYSDWETMQKSFPDYSIDPFASYGATLDMLPSEVSLILNEEELIYAKNNPPSYWQHRLYQLGIAVDEIPIEVRNGWNKNIRLMKSFDELDNQFNSNYLAALVLQGKNEKIAANTEALKSLAKSAFGISTTTPQNIVDEITGEGKAVDQLAQLMSSYYTANPFTTESQQQVINNFMNAYALTPSGTIAEKQSWQDGTYSWVPGTKITIDQNNETIVKSDADTFEGIPTTYFDANQQAARKAIDDINKDDPFAQMKAQFDESRPPGIPSFFRDDPISFIEQVPEPFTDQELLKDLQAAYGDSPEFLQFIAPQLQRIRNEYDATQRPGEDITAKMTDVDSRDFFMGQFEAQKPKSIKDFVNKNIDKYRTEFRTQVPGLYEQETDRIKQQQDLKNLQEENIRRQELTKPITIFGRRRR